MRYLFAIPLLLALPATAPVGAIMPTPSVPTFSEAHELVVVTRNSPTTRYMDADGNFIGLEQDLVELFAQDLGVPVRYVEAKTYDEILPRLERGQAHMAAAGISITPERSKRFQFSPSYLQVQQVLVHNGSKAPLRRVNDLGNRRIEVIADSSAAEHLHQIARRLPSIQFDEVTTLNPEDLLVRVSEGKLDYAVAGSHIVDVARNFYPNLVKGIAFGDKESLAWTFPLDADPVLVHKARDFFIRIKADGTLKRVVERYYGHVKRLDRADLNHLFDSMRTRLPAYRPLFHEAQEVSGIDWRLLAALAFQESHWDPLATSPTGVRGMMMLTSVTADRLGVSDRLDARQSILAGAKYLRDLRDALPARIQEPDRTWMALAAYNQGLGHLEDARVLAQMQKLSPDTWIDVKRTLPLLAQSEWYELVKRGYCRGGEAVVLAENVRMYYDVLLKFEEQHRPETPEFEKLLTTLRQDRAPAAMSVVAN